MAENILGILFNLGVAYISTGSALAIWLQIHGLGLIDPANRKGNWAYRVCITPGLVLLWPVFLAIILRARGGRDGASSDVPFSPRRIRLLQGWAVLLWLMVLPVLGAVVLAHRVADHRQAPRQILPMEAP